mmetsp:Transcript_65156/g.187537  ORF Transcript_65156/g.187537 Transcript_65156/m.187537 type:complete len:208 (+) Transcript_65156:1594-2217(+)
MALRRSLATARRQESAQSPRASWLVAPTPLPRLVAPRPPRPRPDGPGRRRSRSPQRRRPGWRLQASPRPCSTAGEVAPSASLRSTHPIAMGMAAPLWPSMARRANRPQGGGRRRRGRSLPRPRPRPRLRPPPRRRRPHRSRAACNPQPWISRRTRRTPPPPARKSRSACAALPPRRHARTCYQRCCASMSRCSASRRPRRRSGRPRR